VCRLYWYLKSHTFGCLWPARFFSELLQVRLFPLRLFFKSKLLGIVVAEPFTGRMPFLSLNHQHQSTKGCKNTNIFQRHVTDKKPFWLKLYCHKAADRPASVDHSSSMAKCWQSGTAPSLALIPSHYGCLSSTCRRPLSWHGTIVLRADADWCRQRWCSHNLHRQNNSLTGSKR